MLASHRLRFVSPLAPLPTQLTINASGKSSRTRVLGALHCVGDPEEAPSLGPGGTRSWGAERQCWSAASLSVRFTFKMDKSVLGERTLMDSPTSQACTMVWFQTWQKAGQVLPTRARGHTQPFAKGSRSNKESSADLRLCLAQPTKGLPGAHGKGRMKRRALSL